jgi:hypothetical protein
MLLVLLIENGRCEFHQNRVDVFNELSSKPAALMAQAVDSDSFVSEMEIRVR